MCEKKTYNFCVDNNIKSVKLLLAVSGGSDSIALFHLFNKIKKRLDITELGIAHVNHGLRPAESELEETFVSQLAKQEGCRFHIKRLLGKKPRDSGVELWARDERYTFFCELRKMFDYHFLATGHTADDQAETVLMHVSRGCGATGLSGIQPVRNDSVIRPLLNISKKELRNWLVHNGKAWKEDPSNRDLRYKRNKIRHVTIPQLQKHEPKTVEYLAALATHIRRQMDFLKPLINKWVSDNVLENEDGRFVIRKSKNFHDNFIAFEGITQVFRNHSIPFDRKDVESFFTEAKRTSGCFLLKRGWRYYPAKNSVEIVSKKGASKGKPGNSTHLLMVPGKTLCNDNGYRFVAAAFERDDTFHYDTSNHTVFLDAEKTGKTLTYRPIRKTDVFQPLGNKNHVNVMRYLKKQKISNYYRRSTGVLAGKGDSIVWIPGVAIDHNSRITYATEKVFKISFERTS